MIKNTILFIVTMLISSVVFAGNPEQVSILQNREDMIMAINKAVILIGIFIGIILLLVGLNKMKWKAEQPTNPQHSTGMIITVLVAGALMINFSESTTSMITTLLYSGENSGEYCFILEPEQSRSESDCWSASTEEGTTPLLREKIERLDGSEEAEDFKRNIDILMAFFQVIGLIYFLKGAFGLKQVSDGGQKGGYGKPILTMIAAAFVLDLPHTLEMIMSTIEQIGFSIT